MATIYIRTQPNNPSVRTFEVALTAQKGYENGKPRHYGTPNFGDWLATDVRQTLEHTFHLIPRDIHGAGNRLIVTLRGSGWTEPVEDAVVRVIEHHLHTSQKVEIVRS